MSLRRHCLAAVLPLLCACAPQPKGVPPADTSARRVATDVYFIRGRFVAGEQPDGNSVLLRGRTGWVVVDTGRHPAHAAAIEAFVEGSGAPLVAVVNTHWHLDHVGGNLPLRAAYPQVQVHASRQVTVERNGFLARYRTQLETLLRERVDDPQAPAGAKRSHASTARVRSSRPIRWRRTACGPSMGERCAWGCGAMRSAVAMCGCSIRARACWWPVIW